VKTDWLKASCSTRIFPNSFAKMSDNEQTQTYLRNVWKSNGERLSIYHRKKYYILCHGQYRIEKEYFYITEKEEELCPWW